MRRDITTAERLGAFSDGMIAVNIAPMLEPLVCFALICRCSERHHHAKGYIN
jgi:hypothetical protein